MDDIAAPLMLVLRNRLLNFCCSDYSNYGYYIQRSFFLVWGANCKGRLARRGEDKFAMPKAENGDDFEFERTFAWSMHDVQRLIRRNWARTFKASGSDLSEIGRASCRERV